MSTTWAVYECDLIWRAAPQNERLVASGYATALEAMEEANARKRANPGRSYTVGPAHG